MQAGHNSILGDVLQGRWPSQPPGALHRWPQAHCYNQRLADAIGGVVAPASDDGMYLSSISLDPVAVDWPVEHHRRYDPAGPQLGAQRSRLAVTVRKTHPQPHASRAAAMAILTSANLGGDADTIAAIAGQLAGALYGLAAMPAELMTRLAWRERIETLAQYLAGATYTFAPSSPSELRSAATALNVRPVTA